MDRDTIVALGTPAGESAVAVVRVSGPAAIDIVDELAPGTRDAASHSLVLRTLRDAAGAPIDEALVAVMRAPASYTGEDLVEISCHGGTQVASDLLEEIMARGARIAGRGEFTRRAFLSGKMDLAEAEAVADLIAAETKLQRRVALGQLEGALSRRVGECEATLLEELALVEASIDFSEEEIPLRPPGETLRAVRGTRERIARLLESEVAGAKLRRGIRVTIVGPRNVGKSSIYNALLGEERAIVSSVPGTTRDKLCERIHLGGFTCYLEDTAGMAETRCEIEARGMTIGREAADRADLVLFTIDGSTEIDAAAAREAGRIDKAKTLLLINKCDLGLRRPAMDIGEQLGVNDVIVASAATGAGLEDLRRRIYERALERDAGAIGAEQVAVNARQAGSLREADEALARLEGLAEAGAPPELLSVELRAAADALGAVTGRSTPADILDIIFEKFCIGK